jgi:intracellular sulfur oxidation DsrE/DsrF family protein
MSNILSNIGHVLEYPIREVVEVVKAIADRVEKLEKKEQAILKIAKLSLQLSSQSIEIVHYASDKLADPVKQLEEAIEEYENI